MPVSRFGPAEALAAPLAPPAARGRLAQIRATYFGTPRNAVVSLFCLALIVLAGQATAEWLLLDAVWAGGPEACKAGEGACWPFLAEKLRFAVFGFFPYEQQWRPGVAMLLLLAMCAATMLPALWRRELLLGWVLALLAMYLLMAGGILGLVPVPTSQWGGLPLTLMLAVVGFGAGFPLGVALALGRRSRLPAIRTLCTAYIELIRGVPLISLLFMASVMLPLFLPEGWTIDKVLRAQVAIILFAAAYIAEVVRGGLQGIDKGQYEAATAVGLGYWQNMILVILPQALRIVIPPMVTLFIGFFQDTTLVTIVGLFDFLSSIRAAQRDPSWQGIAVLEGYAFAAVVFFVFCWTMARYSRWLEARFDVGHK
ncbi:amino acid ABC transporter permease [Marinimicrococcus flavescens]|uniref:amino acid ABC transporter permease n=1 Tax=Marinimicrococcus flavescens TaxID=3031815 RepID=UPI002E1835F2